MRGRNFYAERDKNNFLAGNSLVLTQHIWYVQTKVFRASPHTSCVDHQLFKSIVLSLDSTQYCATASRLEDGEHTEGNECRRCDGKIGAHTLQGSKWGLLRLIPRYFCNSSCGKGISRGTTARAFESSAVNNQSTTIFFGNPRRKEN